MLLAIVPGLPGLPFMTLSIALGLIGYNLHKAVKTTTEKTQVQQEEKEKEEIRKPENIISLLQVDPMELEIGYSLIPLVDTGQGGDLLERIVMIRRQCALEMGLVVPTIDVYKRQVKNTNKK